MSSGEMLQLCINGTYHFILKLLLEYQNITSSIYAKVFVNKHTSFHKIKVI